MVRKKTEFSNNMSKPQKILGWCYLPIHIILLPLFLAFVTEYSDVSLDEYTINIIYYAIGILFVFSVMFRYLRRDFDNLLDRPGWALFTLIQAYFVNLLLSYAVAALLMLLDSVSNPNNETVMEMTEGNSSAMVGLAVLIGPIVEEVLFRGVVFGSIRDKNRVAAYVVSVLLFGLYHIWQYAVAYGDASLLIYAVQYIPMGIALAWAYERTGSIWTSIVFHMASNALSLAAMKLLENMPF